MSLSLFLTKAPLASGHEVVNSLPMPPVVFGLLALVALVFLLGVVWAFRNLSNHR